MSFAVIGNKGPAAGVLLGSCVAGGVVARSPLVKSGPVMWLCRLMDRMPVSDAGGAGSIPAGAVLHCVGAVFHNGNGLAGRA